jgi:hypothetical protein
MHNTHTFLYSYIHTEVATFFLDSKVPFGNPVVVPDGAELSDDGEWMHQKYYKKPFLRPNDATVFTQDNIQDRLYISVNWDGVNKLGEGWPCTLEKIGKKRTPRAQV